MIPYRAPAVRRLPLTALVDVVFILLFFFMLASSLDDRRRLPMSVATLGADAAPMSVLRVHPDRAELDGRDLDDASALRALEQATPDQLGLQPAAGVDMQRLVDWLTQLDARGIAAQVLTLPESAP